MLNLKYHLQQDWPLLAWAAKCVSSDSTVTIYHGPKVEVHRDWFCEAVWDSEFRTGNFDMTDLVFGSGGRVREGKITFVASGTTVDRLQYMVLKDEVWVSNSLACLMTVTSAKVDPTSQYYYDKIGSVAQGLDKYERELEISHGTVRFMYFDNLLWDGYILSEVEKPKVERDFTTFTKYRDFLQSSLEKIAANMQATERRQSYQWLGTLSSGYDSTTNTVLAQKAGLCEVISFTEARGGAADDGKEIADVLGIQLRKIPRSSWKKHDLAEVPFIAADAKGEDVYFRAAEQFLTGKVLLTGFHGDKVWGKETYNLDTTIVRGDISGLSLSEYRLWTGFIHLPVPFMGVQQIQEINALSNSPEMQPWDVPGNYSRPICRRIVEEAGVDRNHFGMSKKAASVLFGKRGDRLTLSTRTSLYAWLRSQSKLWAARGQTPPYVVSKRLECYDLPYNVLVQGIRGVSKVTPHPMKKRVQQLAKRMEDFKRKKNFLRYAFPWAIEQAKKRYSAFHGTCK